MMNTLGSRVISSSIAWLRASLQVICERAGEATGCKYQHLLCLAIVAVLCMLCHGFFPPNISSRKRSGTRRLPFDFEDGETRPAPVHAAPYAHHVLVRLARVRKSPASRDLHRPARLDPSPADIAAQRASLLLDKAGRSGRAGEQTRSCGASGSHFCRVTRGCKQAEAKRPTQKIQARHLTEPEMDCGCLRPWIAARNREKRVYNGAVDFTGCCWCIEVRLIDTRGDRY